MYWRVLAFAVGLGAVIALLVWQGLAPVTEALATAGWGVLIAAQIHWLSLLAYTLCWRRLIPPEARPRLAPLFGIRWLGEAVNTLLPVARIGGELVKARLITWQGIGGSQAGASVVVDLTVAVATQLLFAFAGVTALLIHFQSWAVAGYLVLGLAVMVMLITAFAYFQHNGLFAGVARRCEGLFGGEAGALIGKGQTLDAELRAIYARRRDLAVAAVWRFGGWLLGSGEIWLAMYFLGAPVTWTEAFIIESLAQAIRGAGFFIPGSLGIQDAGYVFLAGLAGYGADIGLALALIRRVRELLFGLPGLVVWKLLEIRHAWVRVQRA